MFKLLHVWSSKEATGNKKKCGEEIFFFRFLQWVKTEKKNWINKFYKFI